MGAYIVDFVCLDHRLIVELDGSQHGEPEYAERDHRRDAWLEAQGFHVARFWNDEIYNNLDGVLLVIAELLQTGRTPNP